MENIKYYNDAPMLKYRQKLLNIFCFSCLVSAFSIIEQTKAVNDISFFIEESLKSKMGNRIDYANAILINEITVKGKPRVYYIVKKYKKMGSYDVLIESFEHVTLVQLMYSLGDVNHVISVFE